MKKSFLIALFLMAFSPLISATTYYSIQNVSGMQGTLQFSVFHDGTPGNSLSVVTDCPITLGSASSISVTRCTSLFLSNYLNLTRDGQPFPLMYQATCNDAMLRLDGSPCSAGQPRIVFNVIGTGTEPSISCKSLEGGVIDALHSTETPFCASVGTTGGASPQPLLCLSSCGEVCVGTALGFQHFVTPATCTAVTGPDGGNDDGGGDDGGGCTENCNGGGDPTQPGDGGSSPTIPDTSGNPTTVQVNLGGTFNGPNGVTNVNLTLDQDFKPVTDRINETNARLNALQQGQQTTNSTLTQIQQGQQTTNSRLSDISSGIAGLTSAIDGLNFNSSGIESGLSDINTTLQTGSIEGGAQMAGDINLPGEVEFENQIASVVTKITTGNNQQAIDNFGKLGDSLTSFESLQDLFSMASDNCSPIPFGNYSLDLCGAAQISRSVLNWVVAVLLIIFLVKSVVEDLKRLRMT